MTAEEKKQIDALSEGVRAVHATELAETRRHNQLMRDKLYELQHPEPTPEGMPRKVWTGKGFRTVMAFGLGLLMVWLSGCATTPLPVADSPMPKIKLLIVAPPAPPAQAQEVTPCPMFVHTNGLTYVYKNCELAFVMTNAPGLPVTNLVLTFFATNDTSVFLHTGNPTPADIAATTNGFWSARHVWSLQATDDLWQWQTVGTADRPGCSHGVITVENNWGPGTFFRMAWKKLRYRRHERKRETGQ